MLKIDDLSIEMKNLHFLSDILPLPFDPISVLNVVIAQQFSDNDG